MEPKLKACPLKDKSWTVHRIKQFDVDESSWAILEGDKSIVVLDSQTEAKIICQEHNRCLEGKINGTYYR